jgi:hypothetical protein
MISRISALKDSSDGHRFLLRTILDRSVIHFSSSQNESTTHSSFPDEWSHHDRTISIVPSASMLGQNDTAAFPETTSIDRSRRRSSM